MKNKKHLFAVILLMCLVPVLSGCSYFENAEIQLKQSTVGLPLQISTYDFNGQKIDEIKTSTSHTQRTLIIGQKLANLKTVIISAM